MINSYDSNSSNIEQVRINALLKALNFERKSTLSVLILSFITLGAYGPYWMYLRASTVRDISNDKSNPDVYLYLAFTAVPINIVRIFHWEPQILFIFLQLCYATVFTIYMFQLRNRLNDLLGADDQDSIWLGGVGTFFLCVPYMNYKLNRAIDKAQMYAAFQRSAG